MTIYERIKPKDISKDEYAKFLSNDKELAREYAFDLSIYNKNKTEIFLQNVNYKLISKQLEAYYIKENEIVIEIICKYPIELRVDKLLSDRLGLSRGKVKNMNKKGLIFVGDDKNSLNMKARDRMEIHILDVIDDEQILEAIV